MPKSVVRGINHCLVVLDLPLAHTGNSSADRSSIRIMKESGAHAVKLEGNSQVSESVRRITSLEHSCDGTPRTDTTVHL
ncbi:MAG: 3-methyl-2-oxobutanoate hydroxymethyltransferase [Saprospiraceae bacterium]